MLSRLFFFLIGGIMFFSAQAQDCTLDVGGKNTAMIVDIFQLNEEQVSTMEALRGELEITTKTIEDQIKKLLSEHPQSKEADLVTMGEKYRVLQQKIVNASYESDKKLLSTFNTKQYERYLQLCNEAIRRPIKISPKNYDKIEPE